MIDWIQSHIELLTFLVPMAFTIILYAGMAWMQALQRKVWDLEMQNARLRQALHTKLGTDKLTKLILELATNFNKERD